MSKRASGRAHRAQARFFGASGPRIASGGGQAHLGILVGSMGIAMVVLKLVLRRAEIRCLQSSICDDLTSCEILLLTSTRGAFHTMTQQSSASVLLFPIYDLMPSLLTRLARPWNSE